MKRNSLVLIIASMFFSVFGPRAFAIPSYARQTGLPCSGCHYTPPELNAAGRLFKLMGYIDQVKNDNLDVPSGPRRAGLDLLKPLPLSVWFEASNTSTNKPQPGMQNSSFEFPQDVSLFLAGAWSSHVGSFLQVTYNAQDNHFGMDNTDVRYANRVQRGGKDWVYGLTFNNNPTVEDLWNSTPAWGFPFIASDSAPTPAGAPIIQGALAQDVAGVGAFTMWNQHLYFDGTIYRSDHVGSPQPTNGQDSGSNPLPFNIRGVAPYWRLAWQQNGRTSNLEVGFYGIHVKSTPGAVTGREDTYTDFGPDFQYDKTLGHDVLSVRGTYVRENADMVVSLASGAAGLGGHRLNTTDANVEYHFGNKYSTALGWFNTSGTADTTLWGPAAVSGSANGSPKSSGVIANVSWWPMQNLDLAAQYTAYTRFNGANTNYDGSGRNAGANNTLYLLTRFVF